MAHPSSYEPNTGIERWIDARLPVPRLMHDQFLAFPTPRNLNYWWTFGGILTFMLVSQIATGVVLAMHYVGSVDHAFDSIEHLMRDVNWGWLLRYTHAVGAFMGYSLVWGQMSFWAITVITNLFSSLDAVVPGIGTRLVEWIWGGFAVGG